MSGQPLRRERTVEIGCTVTITPSDQAPTDWLIRVATDPDFPYKHHAGRPLTALEGLEHLAYNAVANGVTDASQLDGWGDLDRGMVTMRVHDVEANR